MLIFDWFNIFCSIYVALSVDDLLRFSIELEIFSYGSKIILSTLILDWFKIFCSINVALSVDVRLRFSIKLEILSNGKDKFY